MWQQSSSVFRSLSLLCFSVRPRLWLHEWSILGGEHPGWLGGARYCGNPRRLPALLPVLRYQKLLTSDVECSCAVTDWLNKSVMSSARGFYLCCNAFSFFPAFMTMAIILLHMFWGVVFFDACEKQHWWAVAAVVISHLVVSCLVSVGDVKDNEGVGQFIVKYKLVLLAKVCSSTQIF